LYKKIFEKEVTKLKQIVPEKKVFGIGRLSIQKAELGENENKISLYKIIFKNSIGKLLYEGSISGKFSQ